MVSVYTTAGHYLCRGVETLTSRLRHGRVPTEGSRCQQEFVNAFEDCAGRVGLRPTFYNPLQPSAYRLLVWNIRIFSRHLHVKNKNSIPLIHFTPGVLYDPSSWKSSCNAARTTPTLISFPDSQATHTFLPSCKKLLMTFIERGRTVCKKCVCPLFPDTVGM